MPESNWLTAFTVSHFSKVLGTIARYLPKTFGPPRRTWTFTRQVKSLLCYINTSSGQNAGPAPGATRRVLV